MHQKLQKLDDEVDAEPRHVTMSSPATPPVGAFESPPHGLKIL